MRKRILSMALALCMMLTLLPTAALAESSLHENTAQADGDTPNPAVINLPEPETEAVPYAGETVANTYTVGTKEEFAAAIETIKQDATGATDFTIILTADKINVSQFAGISGKHVTIKSTEGEKYQIDGMGTDLIGDLTLGNVQAYNGNSVIFANGHTFETTEDFQGIPDYSDNHTVKYLYGGGSKENDVTGDTNLILRGGSFSWVYGGGLDSDVSGSTHILIDGSDVRVGNLLGGGFAKDTQSGTVQGDTNLILRQGKAASLYGGGENQNSDADRTPAQVFGDVHITTGYENAPDYTMGIGTATDSNGGSIKSTVGNVYFTMLKGTVNYGVKAGGFYEGGSADTQGAGDRDDVLGTVNITVKDAIICTLNASGRVDAGKENDKLEGYHSRVLNQNNAEYAVHIIWDVNPDLDKLNKDRAHGIVGSGYQSNNDYVNGNVLIEYRNGDLDFIEASQSSSGADFSTLNGNFTVLVTGGRAAYIKGSSDHYASGSYASTVEFSGCTNTEIGYLYYINHAALKNAAHVEINSTLFSQFVRDEKPFYSVDDLSILGGSRLDTSLAGKDSSLKGNVFMNNGTWHAKGRVYIDEAMNTEDSHIIFEKYFVIGGNHSNDQTPPSILTSKNDTFVCFPESTYISKIYGNTTLDKSSFSLMGPVTIRGNWEGGNSLLCLPLVTNNYDGTNSGGNIPLNIDGTATGACEVMVVATNDREQTALPEVGQNYITGYKADNASNETFYLANTESNTPGSGDLFLWRTDDPYLEDGIHPYYMWQVATGRTVTFDKNGGDTEAFPRKMGFVINNESQVDHVDTLPAPPTCAGQTFTGWNTASDGTGTAFTEQTPVRESITVYAQWKPASAGTITLRPLDIAAYTGGASIHGKPFPAVRYAVTAPVGVDVSALTLSIDGTDCASHLLAADGNQASCLIPELENEFVLQSNHSRAASCAEHDAQAGVYHVSVSTPGTLSASDGTNHYDVEISAPGHLTVRHLSDPDAVLNNTVDIAQLVVHSEADVNTADGIAAAVIPADANFYTNGSGKSYLGVLGKNTDNPVQNPQIALLFDDIVPLDSTVDARTQLLIDHAENSGFTLTDGQYQFKYLDLINENDGNAWVSTDRDVTVFWPYPAAVKDNYNDYTFELLHFTGLHREYSDNVEQDVFNSRIEHITAVEKTDKGVKFTLAADAQNGCFSPFALQWTRKSGGGTGGGGGGGTTRYTLSYESGGGTEYKDEKHAAGTVVKLDKAPSRMGYAFTGWYADEALTEPISSIKMTSNKTVYAGWRISSVPGMLNGDEHFAYVVGYVDGTVRPLNNITRGEVATIFFRLLKEDVREQNFTSVNSFQDVTADMWHNNPISTMAKLGVVKGRSSDVFDPDAPITRAEFATICARFDTSITEGNSNFTDISGHWAQRDIERAATLGWIQGYADSTFRPENHITRAEAMTMINRVLCRVPENETALLDGMIVWPDNQPGTWYYLAVQEATNGHEFVSVGEIYERWTKLIVPHDWNQK